MNSKITGKEYPLLKIFSSDFEYHIPAYQRPYAWTEEEAGILFDDLYEFYQNEQNDNYFLGSIVLIKDDNNRHADVIDGQQRLTTLSILFAVLAYSLTGADEKNAAKALLQEGGNPLAGIKAQPRLFLRELDQPFFNQYIQNVQIDSLVSIDTSTLDTESQAHIVKNCRTFVERFTNSFNSQEELLAFSVFLLNRCFLVAVYTPNQESAFRVFSVMNSRGLDLLPTDIIKSETIGKLPADEQQEYTDKWEEMENLTGRDGFNEVFTHTRTIFAKERPKKNLLDEFNEYVLKTTAPKVLIDNYLEPYASAYVKLKNAEYVSTQKSDEINNLLYWLNKTNNYDWMPPAIKFIAEHPNDSEYTYWFIKKLERLASYLLVTSQDVNHRMDRFKWILVEMENRPDHSYERPLKNIELTEWEKQKFVEALNGDIYTMTSQRRNYIVQRLDSFVSDGGASYNAKLFTIEHVLPQNPSAESEWMTLWPDYTQQKYWLNKIANLVPLTRQRNSAAQNFDFETKKVKYFQTKAGTSSYTLTTQVLNVTMWTPSIVESRQKDLIQIFIDNWELKANADAEELSVYLLAGRGGNATGFPTEQSEFVVNSGSTISSDITEGLQDGYGKLRSDLISSSIIKDYEFVQDYSFKSPSAAASVVLGRSSNGRKEWVLLDGRSLEQTGH